ncbi:MAG TPA: glycosyltransferase family A protein [Urbifossiella sp.]|nr:glycosyltransferase family A protein [Urbifossiella sp.]
MAQARGEQVHVLNCGEKRLTIPNVQCRQLGDIRLPKTAAIASIEEQGPADRADRVRQTLELLHRDYAFDAIDFGVLGGSGFRCLQAKRAGLAFENVELIVHLDQCSQRMREQNRSWPANIADLIIDYIEKDSFESADSQATECEEVLHFIRNLNWHIHTDISVDKRPSVAHPLVTVGIAHFNLGAYLPATLESLERQSYRNIEVIVIDDGSTDPASLAAIDEAEERHPTFRFIRQANAGIGATRNRCLEEARGEYLIPMDADNIARPNMVERFVAAIERNPACAAMTCYFLAFDECDSAAPDRFHYAGRPIGGPHALSCIRNIYGDANGIFRTAIFRELGGYETDRGTSCEDWEAYVKLVHAGHRIGVVPDYLFYYRHRDAGFSRSTNWFANHQRVLRQFTHMERLPPGESAVLWTALLGFQQQAMQLAEKQKARRYRIADAVQRWASAPRRLYAAFLNRPRPSIR